MYITIWQIDGQCEFDTRSRAHKTCSLGQPRVIGWGGRCEGGSGEGDTCTPMADSFGCMAKPSQYCKAIILQLKLIKKLLSLFFSVALSLWIISRVLKKLILTIFAFFIAFINNWIFGNPYSTIFTEYTLDILCKQKEDKRMNLGGDDTMGHFHFDGGIY